MSATPNTSTTKRNVNAGKPFWPWVFVTSTVCLYYITHRGNELVQNLLSGFSGWLMTDGYRVYRRMRDYSRHKKARALAVGFLNDWEAIFMVLQHPHLPLTNNEAERALRHWVIMRKISQ